MCSLYAKILDKERTKNFYDFTHFTSQVLLINGLFVTFVKHKSLI